MAHGCRHLGFQIGPEETKLTKQKNQKKQTNLKPFN